MQKYANLVDLEKCRKMSIYYLLAKIGFNTAENEPSKVGPAPGPGLPARRVPRPGRCDQPGSARNGAPALKPPHDAGTTTPPLGWHMIRATSKIGRIIPDLAKICKITEYIIPYHEIVQICWILEVIECYS